MEGRVRREKLIEILESSKEPISGTELSKLLSVSRQVIVQDIALLRAVNKNILSTTKGYIIYVRENKKVNRCFLMKHPPETMEDELLTIVDLGGKVLDVIVIHKIYGEIKADLIISNRQDVFEFSRKIQDNNTIPLSALTEHIHLHTIEADSEEILDVIEEALGRKGYLLDQHEVINF